MGEPWRGPVGECRVCRRMSGDSHREECWVAELEDEDGAGARLMSVETDSSGRLRTVVVEWNNETYFASVDPDEPVNASEGTRPVDELTNWWLDAARAEAAAVIPKAVEYGANSLIEVGRSMARIAQREVSDEEAIEMAIAFYISGKLGRWIDAMAVGRRPSDDSIWDIGIYAKMAQRNRAAGSWPGVDLEDKK